MSNMTGYKATKQVNERLELEGLSTIPPQMVYTYIKKGYIPSIEEDGKRTIQQADLTTWLEGYVTKRHEKAERAAAKIQAELEGEPTTV